MGSAASTGDRHKHEVFATLSELINRVEVFQNMLTGEVIVLLEEDALDFLRNTREEWYLVPRSALQHDYNVAKLSNVRIKERRSSDVTNEEEFKFSADKSSTSSKFSARNKFEQLKEKKNMEILKRRTERSPKESVSYSIFNNSATPSPRVRPRSKLDDVTSPSERLYKEETRMQANRVMQKLDEQRFRKERIHLTINKPSDSDYVANESSKLSPYVFMGKSPLARLDNLDATTSSDSEDTHLVDAVKGFMDKKRGGSGGPGNSSNNLVM